MTNYARESIYNFRMDIIYIDRLFALNLILDYLLVLCSARLCGVRLRRKRYFLSALLGAAYAAAGLLPGCGFLTAAPVKLCAGAAMALIAFGGEEKLWRCCLVFFAVSVLFGGAVWAISMQNGISPANGLYIPVSVPVLVISFGIIYAVLSFVFRRSVKTADESISSVKIEFMGKSAELRCLHDSGNALFDAVTGSGVLIASAASLAPLFPGFEDALHDPDCTRLITEPTLEGRLRLLPYSAVGTQSGLLAAFRPDEILLDGVMRDDILVAISPTMVGGAGFDCVF